MKTLYFNKAKNYGKRQVKFGATFCDQYFGTGFGSSNLQTLSDMGLWHCKVSGNPWAVQGEGTSPQAAVQDSMRRTLERVEQMNRAVSTMALDLQKFFRNNA